MKKKISASIIADSKNEFGQRVTTFVVTFPRIILAELNTHRVFSRNSASSRAIPFEKMVKMVQEDPFIPIAFQKDHRGMQGKEYHKEDELCSIEDFKEDLKTMLGDSHFHWQTPVFEYVDNICALKMTRKDWWLFARDRMIESACIMSLFDVTKQLCNRLLEPFMWHTAIVTATEYENFFKLRCPQYDNGDGILHRSKKDAIKSLKDLFNTDIQWLSNNKSGAEIHISRLAEVMWDTYNESEPKQLKAGEWHIPFGDKMDKKISKKITDSYFDKGIEAHKALEDIKIKIATARCARVSYLNFEGKDDYEADIKLYDMLLKSGHYSPFEHCAQAMSKDEYNLAIKGQGLEFETFDEDYTEVLFPHDNDDHKGWSGNFKGFKQYRQILENANKQIS